MCDFLKTEGYMADKMNNKKHELKLHFDNIEDKENFIELLEHVIGISIDGKKETGYDNYGQFNYVSTSKDEVNIKSN